MRGVRIFIENSSKMSRKLLHFRNMVCQGIVTQNNFNFNFVTFAAKCKISTKHDFSCSYLENWIV